MPKIEIPSLAGGVVNDTMGDHQNNSLKDFLYTETGIQIVRFHEASLRSLHGQETDPQCEGTHMLNGSHQFDRAYIYKWHNTQPSRTSSGDTYEDEIVTNVSQYSLDSRRRGEGGEEEVGMGSSFSPGENLLGQRWQAYAIDSSQQDCSGALSSFIKMYARHSKEENLSVRDEAPSQETLLHGSARFVLPTPPPPSRSPSRTVVAPVLQLPSLLSLVATSQRCNRQLQSRPRVLSDGQFPALERGFRRSQSENPALSGAALDEAEDVFEEDGEGLEGDEGYGFVLPPPAEHVLEPALQFQSRMQRRCSL